MYFTTELQIPSEPCPNTNPLLSLLRDRRDVRLSERGTRESVIPGRTKGELSGTFSYSLKSRTL